jgi:hypothetical protein
MVTRSLVVFGLAAALLLEAPPPGLARVARGRPIARNSHGWMAQDANPKDMWMYVSGYFSNNVLIYDIDKFGSPQIGAITTGINGPLCLSLDAAGTLYVANGLGGKVTIYPAGSTSPSLTLSQGLTQPISPATDSAGNVWVTNDASPSSIVVYPPGQTTPSTTITDKLIQIPRQLTFDTSGNLYFADNTTGVSEIPAGTTQPVSLGLKKLLSDSTNGIAVAPQDGSIFTSFGNLHNQANVYRAGQMSPARILKAPTAGGLTVARHGRTEYLFVPGSQTGVVEVFTTGRGKNPVLAFPVETEFTRCVAVKPPGVP